MSLYTTHSNDTERCISGELQLNRKIWSCGRFVARPYWSAAVSVRGRFGPRPFYCY